MSLKNGKVAKGVASSGIGDVDDDELDVNKGAAPIPDAPIKRKSYIDAVRNGDYQYITELSRNQRAAHFIIWCGQHYPSDFLEWRWIYAAINGYQKAPNFNAKEVLLLRRSSSTISKLMIKKYRTPSCTIPGYIRATYNDEDAAEEALRVKVRRVESANQAMIRVAKLIDVSKIKDRSLQMWATRVHRLLRSVEKTGAQLLPPPKKKKTS